MDASGEAVRDAPRPCTLQRAWSRHFGTLARDSLSGLAALPGGEIALVGEAGPGIDLGGGPLQSTSGKGVMVARLKADGAHAASRAFPVDGGMLRFRVAADKGSGLVVTGPVSGSISLGGETLVTEHMDIVTAGLSPSLDPRYTKRLGGSSAANDAVLTVDGAGNLYLAGVFSGTVDLGGGPLVAQGEADVLVASFKPDGTHRFSSRYGGPGAEVPRGIVLDAAGRVYLTGYFAGTAVFGSSTLVSAGLDDIFLVGLEADLQPRFARRFGGPELDRGNALCGGDALYLTGLYSMGTDLGGGVLQGTVGAFVASFDLDGAPRWSKGVPGQVMGLACARQDASVVIGGTLLDQADFGGGVLESNVWWSGFVAGYSSSSGAYRFARLFKSSVDGQVLALAADATGIYAGGEFKGSIDLGDGPVSAAGPEDAFLVKLGCE